LPSNPVNGEVYIVAAGEDEFADHDHELALYYDGVTFIEPGIGWTLWVQSSNKRWRRTADGWTEVAEGGGGGGGGGTGTGFRKVQTGRVFGPPTLTGADPAYEYILPPSGCFGDWAGQDGKRAVWVPGTETFDFFADAENDVAVDLEGLIYRRGDTNWKVWEVPKVFLGRKVIAGWATTIENEQEHPIQFGGSESGAASIGANFDIGTPERIYLLRNGVWHVGAQLAFAPEVIPADCNVRISICVDGDTEKPIAVAQVRGAAGSTMKTIVSVSGMAYIAANSYIEVCIWQDTGGQVDNGQIGGATSNYGSFYADHIGSEIFA
jgi:hypothetical protein